MQLNRTFLFVPGNHPRKVEKVFEAGADSVILDLEDAVAIAEKAATRQPVAEALKRPRNCRAYVRVNALDTGLTFADLEVVVTEGLDGIVLPMVERAADVLMVDWVITSLEAKHGLEAGKIDLMPIIETGKGLANVREIAAAGVKRMKRLSFGAGDYTRDLGMEWSKAETELLPARSEIVVASRAAELEPPIDTVYIHIRDDIGFRTSAAQIRDLGFQGKLCIHPGQIRLAHSVFTPTDEDTAWARRLIAAFDEAEAAGSASIQVDGYFVDYPIVVKARRIVALSEAAKAANRRH
jgi:citrate lyase subunit beta/citryl-CoA lyase